jgi:hypothetical protein
MKKTNSKAFLIAATRWKSSHDMNRLKSRIKSHISLIYFIISSHSFFTQCNTLQYQRNGKINLVRGWKGEVR